LFSPFSHKIHPPRHRAFTTTILTTTCPHNVQCRSRATVRPHGSISINRNHRYRFNIHLPHSFLSSGPPPPPCFSLPPHFIYPSCSSSLPPSLSPPLLSGHRHRCRRAINTLHLIIIRSRCHDRRHHTNTLSRSGS
jgi:hypothetical protein